MSKVAKISILFSVLVVMFAGALIGMNLVQPVDAQLAVQPGGMAKGSHSVVMTDGTHLIVTDNKTDTLYFYSIDKDAEIGTPLKLRGKLDLSQVGKDVVTPVVMFKKERGGDKKKD